MKTVCVMIIQVLLFASTISALLPLHILNLICCHPVQACNPLITSSRSNNCYLARTTNYQLSTSSATLLPNNIAILLSPPTTCPNPQCLLSSSIASVSPTQIPCTINTRKCILYMYFIPITQHILPTKPTSLLVGIQKVSGP